MTQAPGSHLSPDDIENWLSGLLDAERARHLDLCPECFDRAQVEREIVEQISALPLMGPSAGFANRVMASVTIADPFALRSFRTLRQRIFATRKSIAIAASLALALVGSMAASIGWTMANQDTLASAGNWVLAQGAQAGWIALRGLASNFIEQPWYESARALAGHPARLAIAIGVATLAYLSGVFALRRLLALPTQQVAHVGSGRGREAPERRGRAAHGGAGTRGRAPGTDGGAPSDGARRAAIGAGRRRGRRAGQELLGPRRQPTGRGPPTSPGASSHSRRARGNPAGGSERPVPPHRD